jgi:hypothetical protein
MLSGIARSQKVSDDGAISSAVGVIEPSRNFYFESCFRLAPTSDGLQTGSTLV